MTATAEAAAELDRAIDDLLREGTGPRPAMEWDGLATARLLRETLPRFHPRFSFEEHLAQRLAARRVPIHQPVTEPIPFARVAAADADAHPDDPGAGGRRRTGWLAGSAIASGVSLIIPIAALVVRRRAGPTGGLS